MVGEYLGAEWTASTSSTGNHAAELFDRAWISLPCKRIPMFPRTFRGRKCSARPALSGQLLRCDPRESACRRYSQRKALVNELALLLLPGGLIKPLSKVTVSSSSKERLRKRRRIWHQVLPSGPSASLRKSRICQSQSQLISAHQGR